MKYCWRMRPDKTLAHDYSSGRLIKDATCVMEAMRGTDFAIYHGAYNGELFEVFITHDKIVQVRYNGELVSISRSIQFDHEETTHQAWIAFDMVLAKFGPRNEPVREILTQIQEKWGKWPCKTLMDW